MPLHCSSARAGSIPTSGAVLLGLSPRSLRLAAAWKRKHSSTRCSNDHRCGSTAMRSLRSCARCSARATRRSRRSSARSTAQPNEQGLWAGAFQPRAWPGGFCGARGRGCPCSGCGPAGDADIAIRSDRCSRAQPDRPGRPAVRNDGAGLRDRLRFGMSVICSGPARPNRRSPSSTASLTDRGPSNSGHMLRSLGVWSATRDRIGSTPATRSFRFSILPIACRRSTRSPTCCARFMSRKARISTNRCAAGRRPTARC